MTNQALNDFLDNVVLSGDGGGQGYVCQAKWDAGFTAYVTGLPFFSVTNNEQKETSKALAQKAAVDSGNADRKPTYEVVLEIIKSSVLNKDMSDKWPKGNRVMRYSTFTDAVKEVVIPSIKECEVLQNTLVWCQVNFKSDPFAVKNNRTDEKDENDRTKFPPIPYFAQVFKSRDEAVQFVGSDEVFTSQSQPGSAVQLSAMAQRNNYTLATLQDPKTVKAIQADLNSKPQAKVLSDWGIEASDLVLTDIITPF